MKKTLNVAIAGLGVVGSGVYEILTNETSLLNKRSKQNIKLVAVASRSKKSFVDESKVKYFGNILDIADQKDVDVVVELVGGIDQAYELCKKSLKNGKHFVTANKAMIAIYGKELADLAAQNQVSLSFEASVAGAIPIIKSLKEGLAANKVSKIYAILNGTCNYILTKMAENNLDFGVALKQAQELGYAESDPTFDVENIDSAHKLSILAAIAKNSEVSFKDVYIEGITKISSEDIKFADEMGYKIKSLAVFEDLDTNKIRQSVYPALIKKGERIANVNDSYNAVLVRGNNSDWNFQVGRGAGAKPTASAVVADILDIANDRYSFPFGCDISDLVKVKTTSINERLGQYYLRFYINKDFAKEVDFLNDVLAGYDLIEKSIIKEVDQETLAYALKLAEVKESIMTGILARIIEISHIKNVNLIRIEDLN